MECQSCRCEVADDAPIYRIAVPPRHPAFWRRLPYGSIRYICADCVTGPTARAQSFDRRWHPGGRCRHCARPVFCDARRKIPRILTCGDQCHLAFYVARARQRHWLPKRACVACEVCCADLEFKRPDARYCSTACKQTAYRQRQPQATAADPASPADPRPPRTESPSW
jgi:hypothetical protein